MFALHDLDVDAPDFSIYDSADLGRFKGVLDSAMADLRALDHPLAHPRNEPGTRERMAIALFDIAASGERDFACLKSRALTAACDLAAPASRQRPPLRQAS